MFGAPASCSCVLIYPPIKLAMADDFATDGALTVDNPAGGQCCDGNYLHPHRFLFVSK